MVILFQITPLKSIQSFLELIFWTQAQEQYLEILMDLHHLDLQILTIQEWQLVAVLSSQTRLPTTHQTQHQIPHQTTLRIQLKIQQRTIRQIPPKIQQQIQHQIKQRIPQKIQQLIKLQIQHKKMIIQKKRKKWRKQRLQD